VSKAKGIFNQLRYHFECQYDDTAGIGKLYRRQDAIGTPFCLTIDFETLENDTVTIRERDSMKQQRVPISEIAAIVREKTDMTRLLEVLA